MSTPAGDADDPDLVWHYTDAAGLLGIVESGTLWASHVNFMNDTGESHVLERAFDAFLETVEPAQSRDALGWAHALLRDGFALEGEPEGLRDEFFIVCASTSGDELTLWRNYSRERLSYAIGLDRNSPLGIVDVEESAVRPWGNLNYTGELDALPPVITEQLTQITDQITTNNTLQEFARLYLETRTMWKHRGFVDEREARIAFNFGWRGHWKFRPGAFGLTPYVELAASEQWGSIGDPVRRLPIRAVMLSPQATDKDEQVLRAFLQVHGYGRREFVAVRRSAIPARW